MRTLVSKSAILFISFTVCTVAHGAALQVSVTNHQEYEGFYFTPVFAAFHDGGFDLFNGGMAASAELEALAEGGDAAPLIASLGTNGDGTSRVSAVITAPNGFPGAPVFDPGDSASQVIDVTNASSNRYLTLASMIIPSNDAFFGNEIPTAHEVFAADGSFNGAFQIQVYGSSIYDAGTEVNDGMGAPFSAIGGTSSDEGGVVTQDLGLAFFVGTETAAGTKIGSDIGDGELLATIQVSDPNAVPEPTTFAVWGVLALLGTVFYRKNAKRRQ